MSSFATLGYGLNVRATDLLTAAQAWPDLEPTFRFFDLLFLRKRNGTLSGGGNMKGLVEKVPVEVWEDMRKGVVVREMIEAEDEFLVQYSACSSPIACGCELPEMEETSWKYLRRKGAGDFSSQPCWFKNALWDLGDGFSESYKLIRRLVTSFGLASPLDENITPIDSTGTWNGCKMLDSFALITIPAAIDAMSHTLAPRIYGPPVERGGAAGHSIVPVSLDLPSDADIRLTRFTLMFNLQVMEVSASILRCTAPNYDIGNLGGKVGIEEDEVKPSREVRPMWLLYTQCWEE
ncbi:uncharacterized protein JCM6883_002658 [Sporobolomyces salmoneus]|uniref:uncharacterized protein n=1 Tax=Sporobolomyces salmoneus TaxID=183962 RepID=UPI00317C7C9F